MNEEETSNSYKKTVNDRSPNRNTIEEKLKKKNNWDYKDKKLIRKRTDRKRGNDKDNGHGNEKERLNKIEIK